MARPVSAIESHPQRQKIISALLAGEPYRHITAWVDPPVTIMTLSRYKRAAEASTSEAIQAVKHAIAHNDGQLTPDVTKAVTQAALVAATDPFLVAAEKQTARRSRWMKDIEDAGDYTDDGPDYATLAKLDRNDQTGLELHARLAGRLDTGTHNTLNVAIVIPGDATPPEPSWSDGCIDVK